MQKAWCILGDFSTILRKGDRVAGDEVLDSEIQELQRCIDSCELYEMASFGALYSWINKTIWSRIGGSFINGYWHDTFDYTQAKNLANGLSDHSPILVHFPYAPKPRSHFQFCDI